QRLQRFRREAQLLASLNHPNIAAIYGLEEHGGGPFLVMELGKGPTPWDRLEPSPNPLLDSLFIAHQIAQTLQTAPAKNITQRDWKPANIKFTPDGHVKLLDFGLAKAIEDDKEERSLSSSPTVSQAATVAGTLLGTAAYMSPEQAKGNPVDKRADIW